MCNTLYTMYKNIESTIQSGITKIRQERKQTFGKVWSVIIAHATESGAHFSNPDWLSDIKQVPDTFSIFCDNALKFANDISNILFQQFTKVVYMKTVIPYFEFEIYVIGRKLMIIRAYPIIKNVKTYKLFKPISVESDFGPVLFINPIVELIDRYRMLYSPNPDVWQNSVIFEDTLYNLATGNTIRNIQESKSRSPLSVIRRILFKNADQLGILIGSWAYHVYTKTQISEFSKIQILASQGNKPSDIAEKINNIIRDITKCKVTYRTESTYIPYDYWLLRTTYYITIDRKEYALIDTFNSLDYELIPYHIIDGVQVGNVFVICRFMLIDLWIVTVLKEIKILTESMANVKKNEILFMISKLRVMTKYAYGEQYDGVYKDLVSEKRKLTREQEKYRPYVPMYHVQKTQEVRKI